VSDYPTSCKKFLFFVLFSSGLFINSLDAQQRKYTVANAHAHNDYIHPIPFFTAYETGFGSIEVDIFLRNNELYVAHDSANITTERTLQSLYLNPLKDAIIKNKGYVYNDSLKKLLLLIDIKTSAEATLNKLLEVLRNRKELITCRTLQIVITGNQPDVSQLTSYPPYIYFDGNLKNKYSVEALEKIALFSAPLTSYTKWNGEGMLVQQDKAAIQRVVKKAHSLRKPMRFWAAPDTPNAWFALMYLNVDFINTDKIEHISSFLDKLTIKLSK
jgi:alkaline phosphatase